MRIDLIMAFRNRRALTVASVRAAFASARAANVSLYVTAFDDGSTDGTAAELLNIASSVSVLSGDGNAYWARGMSSSEDRVLSQPIESLLLWLNDDVLLDVDAITRLMEVATANPSAIVVGATRDPVSGEVTYSGMRRTGRHPLSFATVLPGAAPVEVETFNGNVVIVPRETAEVLGGIDGGFAHAFADIDYGVRAGLHGIDVLLAPGTFGTCARNPALPDESLMKKWRRFTSIKGGGHPQSIIRYHRRHAGSAWLAYVGGTFILWWFKALTQKLRIK